MEIVERVAGEAGITKQAAQAAVGGVFDAIAEASARGENVRITSFGTFGTQSCPAGMGRNPRTGESL